MTETAGGNPRSPYDALERPPNQADADRALFPAAGVWVVDPQQSTISFIARHLLVSKIRGVFNSFQGTIFIGADLADTTLQAEASAASVHTGDVARDDHLRSSDFFDVGRWSTMYLTGSGLRRRSGGFLLDGRLTIREYTQPVNFQVTVVPSNDRSSHRARFTAYAKVNRKDFGLRWNATIEAGGVVVGDVIELVLDVEATQQLDD